MKQALANGGDGSVRIFEGSTLKELRTVALGDDADNIRYDVVSKILWVGYGSGALAGLSLNGDKLSDIPVGEHPESFELEHHGNRIFVNVPRKKQVTVVDRTTRKIVASIGTGPTFGNYPMAFDEVNGRIVVACRFPARLLVLDSATGKTVASLDTIGTADDLFYDAAMHRVYVLGGGGSVVTYSQSGANQYKEINRLETGWGGRTGLFIPELKELLVAIPNQGKQGASLRVFQVQ